MRARFILQYEAGRLGNRTFNDREINDFLNKAQLQFIKHRFDALKNRTQRGFQDSIRQAELWGVLSSSSTIKNDFFIQGTPENGGLIGPDKDQVDIENKSNIPHAYGVYVSIPDEAIYLLNESVTTATNSDITPEITPGGVQAGTVKVKRNVPIKVVNYEEYASMIYDPHRQPYKNLVWVLPYGNFQSSEQSISGDGTESSPGIIGITNSTKEWTNTNAGWNIKGITPKTFNTNTEKWIAFKADRSRYLLPGKDWYVVEYTCHYLVTPPEIFIDVVTPRDQRHCVLSDFLHSEIVDLSVELASAAITPEQGKFQANQYENEVNE